MARCFLLSGFLLFMLCSMGQQECWVLFKYKGNFNYGITYSDSASVPVNPDFISALTRQGASILNKSKWLNAVYIKASKEQIKKIKSFSFCEKIIYPAKTKISACVFPNEKNDAKDAEILRKQISLMGGGKFIKQNITGKGIKIGVIDVGFSGYKKTKELEHLIINGNIKGTKDFSGEGLDFGFQRSHGTEVLSCIAGKTDTANIGLATEADFYLASYHRVPQMIEALEWFEEQGVKIVNNSTKIDFSLYDKEDLTGEIMLASKSLAEAAKKGMLIFSSMGNEGDNNWRSLVAPADAKGIISVASISAHTELRSEFSSLGPTYDHRIKPELTAVGETIVANQNHVTKENGTSFSCPLISGFAACAWQLYPLLSKDSLYDLLLKSGSLYPYFDYAHGYGVPQANYFFQLKMPADSIQKTEASIQSEERSDTIFFYVKNGFEGKKDKEEEDIKWLNKKIGVLYNGHLMKREGVYKNHTDKEELDGKNYAYYHIADETGFLKKYCVLKLENENIFFVEKKTMNPGYTLRICFHGYTLEKKF